MPHTVAEPISTKLAIGERAERLLAAMERHPWMVLSGLSALYWVVVLSQSALKLMWLDELFTFYIARTGSARVILGALTQGVDPNPPLVHLLSMWSMRLYGENAFGLRLPEMFAGWGAVAGLYVFLRARLPVVFAAVGACSIMAMAGFDYSYEGRPYALLLGFSIASLLLWRATAESQHRTLAAVALALVLAASISSNYFGGLAVFPIAIGEAARSFKERRILWRVWLALLAGTASIIAYLPLIRIAREHFLPHAWNKAYLGNAPAAYFEMVEYVLCPALLLLAAALAANARDWPSQRVSRATGATWPPLGKRASLPLHETAAALALAAYPLLGYAAASAMSGMISARCVIPVCFAFAILIAIATARLFASRPALSVLVLAVFLAWIAARESVLTVWLVQQRRAFFALRDEIPLLDGKGKILVPDSLLVLPLCHYGSANLASRIILPIDFPAIRKHKGEDSAEQNLWAGRGHIFPMSVQEVGSIQGSGTPFLVIASANNWFLGTLREGGRTPRLIGFSPHGDEMGDFTPLSKPGPAFYSVEMPDNR